MNNFIFENKTKVYFGKGGVKEYLGSLLVNYGETVMLGAIRKTTWAWDWERTVWEALEGVDLHKKEG